MEGRNQAEVKERLFSEFIPLDIDATVIELVIDELNCNEEECRRQLSAMTSNRRGREWRRTVHPQAGANRSPTTSGSDHSPASPRSGGSRAAPARGYGGAVARAPPPVPAPRRPPPPPAVQDANSFSTPLQQKLAAGVRLLVLMRGLPGSGKTTLAKQLAGRGGLVVSADDYFVNSRGQYVFNPAKLSEAHEWCRQQARAAMRRGRTPVVVDNTNTQAWEMQPYVKLAVELDYYVEYAEPTTPWRHDPRLLSKRSVHSVPERNIERMMLRFESSDRLTVVALYGTIGEVPKPWPPPVAPDNILPAMDTAASLQRSAAPAAPVPARAAVPPPAPAPTPAPATPPRPKEITMEDMASALNKLNWAQAGAEATERVWSSAAAEPAVQSGTAVALSAAFGSVVARESAEAGCQTGGGGGRTVSPRPWRPAPAAADGPPPLTVPLHRGTMTSPPPESVDHQLDGLTDLFPTVPAANLQHILDQCGGDVDWAISVLLETDLESLQNMEPPRAEDGAAAPAETGAEQQDVGDVAEAAAGLETMTPPPPSVVAQGARPKQPLQLSRQLSSDSEPDVIVEDLSGASSDDERPPPPRAAAGVAGGASSSSSSSSGSPLMARRRAVSAGELKLQLTPRLAYQLQELFGPTKFGVRSEAQLAELPASELAIHLPLEVASSLHRCWTADAEAAFDAEQRSFDELGASLKEHLDRQREEEERKALLKNDEEIARQLQMEEDGRHAAASPTPRLREIMAEQQAVQRSEQAQSSWTPATQADRLTRQRLREEFPGVDASYLDELLDMHEGDYKQVLRVLQGTRGERPLRTASIRAPSPPPLPRPTASGGAVGPIPADFLTEKGMPSFHDIRAESELIRQKIEHAKMMAERAVRRGAFSVSQYYVAERQRLYAVWRSVTCAPPSPPWSCSRTRIRTGSIFTICWWKRRRRSWPAFWPTDRATLAGTVSDRRMWKSSLVREE
ncbi:uncharacterized protein LOC122371062 [Amphibalanus amphitrite]|uniref:uncharacterized protein LOC122371062 n=1 Tax=Amphibalanus amphitrite TaxID=1232801 RepID=UPI001C9029BA|nr:uncharacterized protein LOC122371062 [Amphibalanus amphitrite]